MFVAVDAAAYVASIVANTDGDATVDIATIDIIVVVAAVDNADIDVIAGFVHVFFCYCCSCWC